MTETTAVAFNVIGVEHMRRRGDLAALATVELEIAGVVLVLQGCRVLRQRDGTLAVRAPAFRSADGQWRSAVVLPDALSIALGAELLAAFAETPV